MDPHHAGAARWLRRTLVVGLAGMLMLVSLSVPAARAAVGDLRTIAGGTGDGGQAPGSALVRPYGVAAEGGSVYVADATDHRVRKIDSSGIITTIAGTGVAGSDGDGGPGIAATLNTPNGIAVDAAGNVLFADEAANVVRKVSAAGTISTVAGKGTAGWTGDDGLAIAAELSQPTDVAVDAAGNLFIADFGNKRVRKVSVSDGNITTIAGNGTSAYQGDGVAANQLPVDARSVAVDSTGGVYISDYSNSRVRKIMSDGTLATFAGVGTCPEDLNLGTVPNGDTGPATLASLCRPTELALDSSGNLFVADTGHQLIRKIDSTGTITTIAGAGAAATQNGDAFTCPATTQGGPAAATALCFPSGVAADAAGVVYVSDTGNALLRKIDAAQMMQTAAGGRFAGDGGPAAIAVLSKPRGVAIDGNANVYVSDTLNHRVRRISSAGVIETMAGNGAPGSAGDGAPATAASLNAPVGLTVEANGVLYIADTGNDRIRKVDAAGIITTVAGTGTPGSTGDGGPAAAAQLNKPEGVALDADGILYIADTQNDRIRAVDGAGIISTVAGNGTPGFTGDGAPAAGAQINKPSGVAAFEDILYIADSENHRIRKVDAAGIISSIAGTGGAGCADGASPGETALTHPEGVAVDALGQLFIADTQCGKLHKLDTEGKIAKIAGTGTVGYSGDAGVAVDIRLGRISAVATDRTGGIYAADTTNDRIRLVEGRPPDGTPPAPSIGVTPALTGLMTISFNEVVKNVTPSNVVLRASGSGANVPSAQACRDQAGAFVDCATGKVTSVRLDPSGVLTPGQTYSLIVNPADASVKLTDVAGNAAPLTTKAFRASTVEQESSMAARYAWRNAAAASAMGRSYAVERTPGATGVVTFSGRSITWYTATGPDQGLATVYIDGIAKGTFNQYATSTRFGVARVFDGLANASHRFTLVVRGLKGNRYAKDALVTLDAIRAGGVLSPTPSVWYGWQNVINSKVSGGRYVRSNLAGSSAMFSFRGTGIDWYTLAGPTMGIAAVYVDGVLKATIDNFARTETYNVRRSLRGLSNAAHTIRIIVSGRKNAAATGTLVSVDRYAVV